MSESTHLDKSDGNFSPCPRFVFYLAAESLILKAWLRTSRVSPLLPSRMKAETCFRQHPSLLPAAPHLSLHRLATPNSDYMLSSSPRSRPQKRLLGFSEPLCACFTINIMEYHGQPRYIFPIARGVPKWLALSKVKVWRMVPTTISFSIQAIDAEAS